MQNGFFIDGITPELGRIAQLISGRVCTRICGAILGLMVLLPQGHAHAQQFSLDNDVWELLVLPVDASDLPLETLFESVLDPIDYEETWVVIVFDSVEQQYVQLALTDPIELGAAFWIKQITGQTVVLNLPAGLDEPDVAVLPTPGCLVPEGCYQKVLSNQNLGTGDFGYNMIGSPFNRETDVADLVIVGGGPESFCFEGCSFDNAVEAGIIAGNLFTYSSQLGEYVALSIGDTLSPWQGFWSGPLVESPVENPALLFPATPEDTNPCDGVINETDQCPFPSILVNSSPFDIDVSVGTPVSFATTVDFNTVRSDTYQVIVTQTIEAIAGDAQNLTVAPALIGGFQSAVDRTTVDNQSATAFAEGVYQITTTATIEETEESASSIVTITASASSTELTAGAPGFTPPTVLPLAESILSVSVFAGSTDMTSALSVSVEGAGLLTTTLLDNGIGADLSADDGAYSGFLTIPADLLNAGECVSVTAVVQQGDSSATSEPTDVCASNVVSLLAPQDFSNVEVDNSNNTQILLTEILVSVNDGATDEQLENLAELVSGELVGSIPQIGVYQIALSGSIASAADLQTVIELIEAQPFVEYAEPSSVASTQFVTPSDPRFSAQSALTQIRADEAWAIARGGATIAVVDTGADLDHPDLAANLLDGYDFFNGDNDPEDDHGHGTHVSGIAAAIGNNAVGIAGVAWQSKILPVKACGADIKCSLPALAAGIIYSADKGAKVINVSAGGYNQFFGLLKTVEKTLCRAVSYASDKGALVVSAAGNDSRSTRLFPAACPGAIAVGNVTDSDQRYVDPADGSNFGAWVDIAAPGVNILSTVPIGGTCSFCNSSGYGSATGTSMSSPLVAGAVAVLLSRETLSNTQILERLQRTAVELPSDAQLGKGRIDLFESVFNGSFEEGNLALWKTSGTASSKSGLGSIMPQHRQKMGSVSTGPADAQVAGSIEQEFSIQPGISAFPLSFKYAFVTEEYPEFVGSEFDDSLRVVLITPQGVERLLAEESVNESSFISIDGIDFPGGDETVGWTGWQSVSVNVTVTQGPGIYRVSLRDAGDAIYDTETLIDDIKFESSATQQ